MAREVQKHLPTYYSALDYIGNVHATNTYRQKI